MLEPILVPRRLGQIFPRYATSPGVIFNPGPVYPPLLRSHRIEGEARIAFVVAENGTTRDVECVEANDRRFGEAAVEAIKQWRFTPAMWEGKPIAMNMEVPVVFTLDGNSALATPRAMPANSTGLSSLSSLALSGDPLRDFQALQKLHASRPPPEFVRAGDDYFTWLQERARTRHDLGIEYISRYATDARRWEVLLMLQYGRNHRLQTLRDGTKQMVPDEGERAAWDRKYYSWLEALIAARDANDRARAEALRQLIDYGALSVRRGDPDAEATMPAKVLGWMDRFERENPGSGPLASLYRTVAMMLNAIDPARCRRFLQEKRAAHAADNFPDVQIRDRIDRLLRLVAGQEQPVDELWQQLQTLDPTFTDVSRYRGKVVLIAWLAVDWSSRTMELEELYRKYHDAGFEIVQVAYRNASVTAPAEQRDQAAMQRYVAAKQWPWRVVWDPKDSAGESFASYWGQNTIPALFLIGRDGRIVRERPSRLTRDEQIADEIARPRP